MEKEDILNSYVDACALVKETERELGKSSKKTHVQGSVRGSMHEFPYTEKNFHYEGDIEEGLSDSGRRTVEITLRIRKAEAAKIKAQAEKLMNTFPLRMQRIVEYRIMQGMTWEDVAIKIGRGATGDGIRMEFKKFIKES